MNTFFSVLIAAVFSIPAFAGFNTSGDNHTEYVHSATKSTLLRIHGHSVELGKAVPDAYGNFTQQEIMALTLMLMDPLQALPSGESLRKRHQSFQVQIVKGATFQVERKAERGFLRVPELTFVKITIPATASFDEVGKYLARKVTLTANETDSASSLTRELVAPRELNGCEMHLYNLMAGSI